MIILQLYYTILWHLSHTLNWKLLIMWLYLYHIIDWLLVEFLQQYWFWEAYCSKLLLTLQIGINSMHILYGALDVFNLSNQPGAYLATHESRNFGGDTLKKGTTPKFKFLKLIDMVKQIVCIGVNDPAESKSGLIFGLGLLFHCIYGSFCRKLWKILKTSGSNC